MRKHKKYLKRITAVRARTFKVRNRVNVELTKENTVFIIGNGPSRNLIDLHSLPGSIYACNRAYQDPLIPQPELLFATDKPMLEEILASNYSGKVVTRSKNNIKDPRVIEYDSESKLRGSSTAPSGIRALIYAAHQPKWDYIFLIGFDLYDPAGTEVKNVYAGTKLYEQGRQSVKTSVAKKWVTMLEEWSPFFIRVVAGSQCYRSNVWTDIELEKFLSLSGAVASQSKTRRN